MPAHLSAGIESDCGGLTALHLSDGGAADGGDEAAPRRKHQKFKRWCSTGGRKVSNRSAVEREREGVEDKHI